MIESAEMFQSYVYTEEHLSKQSLRHPKLGKSWEFGSGGWKLSQGGCNCKERDNGEVIPFVHKKACSTCIVLLSKVQERQKNKILQLFLRAALYPCPLIV